MPARAKPIPSVAARTGGPGESLDSPIDELIGNSRIIVTCGSGGVGKTTLAASIGLFAAQRHALRVLVLTIDPARRLATALGLHSIGNDVTPIALDPSAKGSLAIAMLDTSASWDDLIHKHAPDRITEERILANPLYRNITQRFVQSHDYVAVERLLDLRDSDQYDLLIVDTPPSRNALDFLDAPERMADFFSSTLLKWITMPYRLGGERAGRLGYLAAKPFYQVADRILGSQFLEDIAEFFLLFQSMYDGFVDRAALVTGLLEDRATSFLVVTTLEPGPIDEAEFLVSELGRRRLQIAGLLCNRVLAEPFRNPTNRTTAMNLVASDDRLARAVGETFGRFAVLAEREQSLLRQLATRPDRLLIAPLRQRSVTDLDALAELASLVTEVPPPTTVRRR